MIRILTEAFGLTAGEITYGSDDRAVHAELGRNNGIVMVGSGLSAPG